MSEYTRTTRKCSFDALDPDLAAAIAAHLERYDIDDALPSVTACFETTSTQRKRKLFGTRIETSQTAVVVTPRWLIWAARTGAGEIGVLSARLADIRIMDYEASPEYRLMPDSGVDVHGRFTNAIEVGSAFIGLGPEGAAGRFRNMVREAIGQAG